MSGWGQQWAVLLRRLDRLAGSPDAAEDALQAAFVRVADYGRSQTIRAPQALIAHTAANLARDARRRGQRQAWQTLEDLPVPPPDEAPLQDEVLAARERLRMVQAVLARMPPRTRMAFLLHRVDGLKYRQIAEHMEISQSAVEKHIARGVFLLAEAMHALEPEA